MDNASIALAGALAGGVVTSVVNSWLAGRSQVAEELREARGKAYPAASAKTRVVSRWPRAETTSYEGLAAFHDELRGWYYDTGGIFLSVNARRRYGHMQEVVGAVAGKGPGGEALRPEHYDLVRDASSAFRTALTEDLESRRQRSLLTALRLGVSHVREDGRARRRLRRARTA